MNLKEVASLPAFQKLRENIKRIENDAITALISSAKASDHDTIKLHAGIVEGIQRVEAYIDREIKRHVDESRKRAT